jgi:PIN domain nuclease of toxin-antitoxin system
LIVLDTHALIWFAQGDERLGATARQAIIEHGTEQEVLVPAIAVWEVALVTKRNKVVLGMDAVHWTRRVLATPGFSLAPLEPEIAIAAVLLSWEHKDPADRMIVATALARRAALVTVDHKIKAYARKSNLQVIDGAS